MSTARLELKLSQKDVAQKINEKPSIIQDYEGGKAIPNPQILGKLERLLGVKLRGKYFPLDENFILSRMPLFRRGANLSLLEGVNIGQKLTAPGKKWGPSGATLGG